MLRSPIRLRVPLAASVVLGLAACASTPNRSDDWSDASLAPYFLRGATVAVACEAPDLPLQNICRDQLAASLRARGVVPVFLSDGSPMPVDARALPGARASGARGVVVVAARPLAVESEPAFSIGLGGFGFGRNSAIGGGITAPVGPTRVETAWSVNGRAVDVGTERVVWTATRNGRPGTDASGQIADLTDAVLDAAQQARVF